jgi:hypothetical protein
LFIHRLGHHSRTENDVLYPKLLAHPDEGVRAKASALYAEGLGTYDDTIWEVLRRA